MALYSNLLAWSGIEEADAVARGKASLEALKRVLKETRLGTPEEIESGSMSEETLENVSAFIRKNLRNDWNHPNTWDHK